MSSSSESCPRCGQLASGDFCSHCGAPQTERSCPGCGEVIAPGARFCAGCGRPIGAGATAGPFPPPRSERTHRDTITLSLVGILLVAVVTGAVWYLGGGTRAAVAPTPTAADGTTRASTDIWSLSPGERFTRLTDRIQTAVESGDTAQVVQFVPMAEGAWEMLGPEDRTVDARYHIALIRIQVGQVETARIQLDSLMAMAPGNLMGRYLEALLALAGNDTVAYRTAKTTFDRDWSREIASDRPEYAAHMPLLEAFHQSTTTP